MIKVNLVPAEILSKAAQRQQVFQLSVVGVAVVLLIAMVSGLRIMKARNLAMEREQKQRQYALLQKEVEAIEALKKTIKDLTARLKDIDTLRLGRPVYPRFLADFAKSVPAGVWVKTLGTSSKKEADKAVLTMNISAEAQSSEDIKEWIRKLKELKDGNEPKLDKEKLEIGPVQSPDVQPKIYSFTLTGIYKTSLTP